jgi:hypothetical protein
MATPTTNHECSIGSFNKVSNWLKNEHAAIIIATTSKDQT